MAKNRSKLEVINRERVPSSGVMIVPNRLEFTDMLHLEKELAGRRIVYLVERSMQYDPLLQAHLEKEDVLALEFSADTTQREVFKKQVHSGVASDEVLVFIPGPVRFRSGQITHVPSGVLRFLIEAGAPVLPLFVDHPVDTRLSIESVTETDLFVFSFGKILEREAVTVPNYQENLLLASEEAFNRRSILGMSLPYALLRGLKRHGTSAGVVDGGQDDRQLRFDKLLAAALALAGHIKKQTNQPRVGILLPPGIGGLIANAAVLLAGKIPVNLNFTAGDKAVASCIQQAGLDRFITADPFVRKMSRFAWPPNKQLIFIERVLPELKMKTALWLILSKLLSTGLLARLLGLSPSGGKNEAVLLFTSGSSGEPKGVVLSHRNVLANVTQFGARIHLQSQDRILGCLPLFHSFGCTVTLWYPIIEGLTIVTYPSPLETPKLAELIERHSISLVLVTPTFLRGYLRKVEPRQLASTKLIITGAEKLPAKLAEAFEERFRKPVLEGYGLTETSPVTSVNLPDAEPDGPQDCRPVILNHRPGSVGQLIPGMALRISDPDTDEPLPLNSGGMIWLRGANIFEGYLHQPEKSAEVLRNNWFRTGDLGRMDEDGFLYIEGRLSRFSKIAGEMVPHETVEDSFNHALGFDSEGERCIAVVGVPDESKGESLILLCSRSGVDPTDLRYRLLDAGLPSLWIPKKIIEVSEIPALASGKLNLKLCVAIALGEA